MDHYKPEMMKTPNFGFEAERAVWVHDSNDLERLRGIIFRALDGGSAHFNALRRACLAAG